MKNTKFNVNTIPSLTWNWLKMNRDSITIDASFAKYEPEVSNIPAGITICSSQDVLADLPQFGSGISNIQNKKMIDSRVEEEPKEKTFTFSGVPNHPLNDLFDEVSLDSQFIKIKGKVSEPLVLNFASLDNTVSEQTIYATENSEATIILLYTKGSEVTQLVRTHIYAEEYAKIHIVKVQLLDKGALQLDDTAFAADDKAQIQFTQIELGGQHIDSGLHVNLNGFESNFKSHVAYLCQEQQYLDMNHIVYHFGKKSECNMQVNGTVKDTATKTYRGTIDFKNGCCGSKGNEMEETLLLSPKAVNKSLPVILCDEEEVEGEHGSTIGRISNEILFYMQTRGISQKEAEQLLSRAKIQAAADLIPDEGVKDAIAKYMEEHF